MTDELHKTEGGPAGDLNEVLRLQAAALARMSERMDTHRMAAARPPIPPPPERHGLHLPVLASDAAALTEDSLPVLNAFREFLEQERRRTRARVLWVSLSFAVVFGITVSAVVWLGRERIRELRSDLGSTNKRVDDTLQSASEEIRKVSEAAGRTVSTIQRDVNSTILNAQSAIASNVNVEMKTRDAEIDLLKEKLSSLEIENAVLLGRLREATREAEARARAVEEQQEAREGAERAEETTAGTPDSMEQGLEVGEPAPRGTAPESAGDPPIVIQTPAYNRPVRLKMPAMTP